MAYTITGEKCGTVRLDAEKTGVVVTESVQRSSKVTSNPVEKGSDINDHVINDPVVFSITGVFLDEDQSDILERMWKEKDVVEYTGRTRISDCVITSFKSDISADNKNGSKFTVSLKVINRVSAEYVASGEQMMSAQDANASKRSANRRQNRLRPMVCIPRCPRPFPPARIPLMSTAMRTRRQAAADRLAARQEPTAPRKGVKLWRG